MIELHERIVVPRSIEDCFRYLLDFSTIEEWDPGVYRAEKVTGGAPREGSCFELILDSMGRRIPMEYELLRIIDGKELVLHGEGDAVRADDRITLERLGDEQTAIDYRAELEFKGFASRAEVLMRPWLDRVGRHAVEGLKRALTPTKEIPSVSVAERLKYTAVAPAAWEFTERGYLKMENKGLSEFVDGATAVITGPTSGLGLATAKLLARLGARLILIGRNETKMEEAARQIEAFCGAEKTNIEMVYADLSEMAQVERAAEEVRGLTEKVDILINNAGALFGSRGETSEGHERTLAINLLCPYLLTEALRDSLEAGGGRVINISSGGMYTQGLKLDDMEFENEKFDGAKAYARAKRALVALTDHWAEQYPDRQVTFHSMHPGWADTPGVEKSLPGFHKITKSRLRDARMGADTIVWLATSAAVAGESGGFYLDRRPRPTAVFPGTEVSPDQRRQLVQWLNRNRKAGVGSRKRRSQPGPQQPESPQ